MRGDAARSALAGTRFADVRWVDETGSTNRDLLDLARSGAPEGVVLVADHQTAGRGRLDRTWVARPGSSLLMSVLLRPPLPAADAHLVTMAMGVAAAEASAAISGVEAGLKWPNDLVFEDRKLAGVLAQSGIDGGRLDSVVVGIGLNLTWNGAPPADLAGIAVALDELTDRPVERDEVLVAVLQRFEHWYGGIADGAADASGALAARARELSATLGRQVRAELGQGSVEGTATDLDDRGNLVVVDAAGARHVIAAGDVVHLRGVS
jgi:BirA family transcriptional regulator, biotin operon repressor / biotin---[acetyl-CoA-carboxylase] ligase